jgi:ABC-type phosphate/phosphonate transport system permease subunit
MNLYSLLNRIGEIPPYRVAILYFCIDFVLTFFAKSFHYILIREFSFSQYIKTISINTYGTEIIETFIMSIIIFLLLTYYRYKKNKDPKTTRALSI